MGFLIILCVHLFHFSVYTTWTFRLVLFMFYNYLSVSTIFIYFLKFLLRIVSISFIHYFIWWLPRRLITYIYIIPLTVVYHIVNVVNHLWLFPMWWKVSVKVLYCLLVILFFPLGVLNNFKVMAIRKRNPQPRQEKNNSVFLFVSKCS